jgi:hypothetical protein
MRWRGAILNAAEIAAVMLLFLCIIVILPFATLRMLCGDLFDARITRRLETRMLPSPEADSDPTNLEPGDLATAL